MPYSQETSHTHKISQETSDKCEQSHKVFIDGVSMKLQHGDAYFSHDMGLFENRLQLITWVDYTYEQQ